jgi:hypothetical protein
MKNGINGIRGTSIEEKALITTFCKSTVQVYLGTEFLSRTAIAHPVGDTPGAGKHLGLAWRG